MSWVVSRYNVPFFQSSVESMDNSAAHAAIPHLGEDDSEWGYQIPPGDGLVSPSDVNIDQTEQMSSKINSIASVSLPTNRTITAL